MPTYECNGHIDVTIHVQARSREKAAAKFLKRFGPNARLESVDSDYAICFCDTCGRAIFEDSEHAVSYGDAGIVRTCGKCCVACVAPQSGTG